MRIAIVSQGLDSVMPPLQNSVGLCTYAFARELAAEHDVTAYGRGPWRSKPLSTQVDGAIFKILPSALIDGVLSKAYQYLAPRLERGRGRLGLKPFSSSSLCFPWYMVRVGLSLRRLKPEIIHIQHSLQFAPILKRLNPQAEVVVQLHAAWALPAGLASTKRELKAVDAVLGVSKFVADHFARAFPDYPGVVSHVYDGVEPRELPAAPKPGTSTRRLLYLGQISPHKGVHDAISAFIKIADAHPDVSFEIVGPFGAYPLDEVAPPADSTTRDLLRPFYEEASSSLTGSAVTEKYLEHLRSQIPPALVDRIRLHGQLARAEVIEHLRHAHLFVFPSLWNEGFGMPVVEAMASSTPVIATRSGAVVETMVDGKTGILVEKADVDAMADAIDRLLHDDALHTRMSTAARVRAIERFSWSAGAVDASAIYKSLRKSPPDRLTSRRAPRERHENGRVPSQPAT